MNQAVAKLNATGQRSADLLPYAAESMRRPERLDAAAENVRRRLPGYLEGELIRLALIAIPRGDRALREDLGPPVPRGG